ncbi:rRNA-processing protein UTP23 [Cocos nucifera]|uniref:rRNA-processing protein UTP23 n=1 Tax=Cocos nucifera TaxID=13894 RepID=A0A8K0N740_COCNU|nr:rRNA-processing protein UTP23 [Cocos nucifera]
MRVKKQKRHRKVVRFFTACFGFREPFKVLCDGTFVHHLLLHHLTPADDALSRLLGGRALLFTTRCIIGELKSLGESHYESLEAAQQLITARCDHERRVSAMACIESVIGEGNSEHFFVATQDADIRKKFREVPGVPVIYGLRNSLFIEQPSALQREYVKSTEGKRLHANESEFRKLLKRELKGGLANDSGNEVLEEAQLMRNISTAKKMLGVAEKSKFKRKKAKGPNPLSCKKKKRKDDSSVQQNEDGQAGGAKKRKRTRKRKITRKNGKPGEPGS